MTPNFSVCFKLYENPAYFWCVDDKITLVLHVKTSLPHIKSHNMPLLNYVTLAKRIRKIRFHIGQQKLLFPFFGSYTDEVIFPTNFTRMLVIKI